MNTTRIVLLGTIVACLILGGLAGAAGEETVATLIDNLKSADESVRLQAIDELGARGAKAAEAVAPLAELLKDGSAKVRAHAAWSLGEIGAAAKPVVPALAELLKDSDETVRRQVVKAVMHIRPGPQVTVPLCVKLLEDSDPGVRMRILNAISDAGPQAVPGLIEALKNEKAAYWACLVLRDMGPAAKDAVPALVGEAHRIRDPKSAARRSWRWRRWKTPPLRPWNRLPRRLATRTTRRPRPMRWAASGRFPPTAEDRIRANVKSKDKVLRSPVCGPWPAFIRKTRSFAAP